MRKIHLFMFAALLFAPAIAQDIVTHSIVSRSSSTLSNVPVTFGQVFIKGDVPSGKTVGARLSSGEITLQTDAKATYRDGSLRHAVLSLLLPSLSPADSVIITLFVKDAPPSGTAPLLSELLSTTYDAKLNIKLMDTASNTDTLFSATAKEALQNAATSVSWNSGSEALAGALASNNAILWLNGPIVNEWIVHAPLKTSGNSSHPHLEAYFHVRAYSGLSRVRTTIVLENNWTYEPNPWIHIYNVSIDIENNTRYSRDSVTHYNHARWRKDFFWGGEFPVYVRQNSKYLSATGAVLNYDYSIVASERELGYYKTELTSGDNRFDIMGYSRTSIRAMGSAGQDAGLGILPAWAALYCVSNGDPRALDMNINCSDAMGSVHIHQRDKNTGLPVSIDTYPGIVGWEFRSQPAYNHGMPWPTDANNQIVDLTPYQFDPKKHPSNSFFPYLVTGDYFHLEELQFLANYCLLWRRPVYRGYDKGLFTGMEPRHIAYMNRSLGQAAAFTPDNHPQKSYYVQKCRNNVMYMDSMYVSGTSEYSNEIGWIGPGYSQSDTSQPFALSGWMNDLATANFGYVHQLDIHPELLPFVKFKAKYSTGKWTNQDKGVCWKSMGPAYSIYMSETLKGPKFTTWEQIYQACNRFDSASYPLDCSTLGYNNTWFGDPRSYPYIARGALAFSADVGEPKAADALYMIKGIQDSLTAANRVYTSAEPQWALLPRDTAQLSALRSSIKEALPGINCYPNPFNPSVRIEFGSAVNYLAHNQKPLITVYSIAGRIIHKQQLESGIDSYTWNAAGNSSGFYLVKLAVGNATYTKRVLLRK